MLAIPEKRRFLITVVVTIVCIALVNFGLYYLINLYYIEENGYKIIVTVGLFIVVDTIIMIILLPRNKKTPPNGLNELDDMVDEDLDEKKDY